MQKSGFLSYPELLSNPDCIRNAFRASGRRHLLLTGGRGSGKTTLLSKLLSPSVPGITTFAVPKEAVYLQDNQTKEVIRIGRFDGSLPGAENKMRPLPEGFHTLGILALKRCMESESEWVSIDEIGYLESGCPQYRETILRVMERKRLIAAVRRQELPFLSDLCRREDVFLLDLDAPFGNSGCVIMASGLGSRFGCNKLMADFYKVPMIRRIFDATGGIFRRRVTVTRHRDVQELCVSLGIPVVYHELPFRSDTVRLGLQAIGSDANSCMFCPGDQPLLRRDTIISLALGAAGKKDAIWRPAYEGTPGSPVVFPRWSFPQLLTLPEGKGGSYVAKQHPGQVRFLPVKDPMELMDADTPEDLKTLLGHYQTE